MSVKTAQITTFSALLSLLLLRTSQVHAHVGYVLSEQEFTSNAGFDFIYLGEALQNPLYLSLIFITILAVFGVYFFSIRLKPLVKEMNLIKKEAESYTNLVPWMLRLSLGIAMVGAGTSGVLISPLSPATEFISFMQILSGFLLMTGLFVAPATYTVITIYIAALFSNTYYFGNFDMFGAALALLILADAHPGVDDLLGIPFLSPLKKLQEYVPLILRISLGSAMMYLAVWEKLLNPHTSALVAQIYNLSGVIPVSVPMWVFAAGVIEFAVGLAIFAGLRTRVTVTVAIAVLSMSFFFFKEDVYSHITLFGVLSIIFVTGSGRFSLDEILDPYFRLKLTKDTKK